MTSLLPSLDAPTPLRGKWVAIVANPFSGRKANAARVAALVDELTRLGITAKVVWDPQQREQLLRDAHVQEGCRCIVAAGGDGTLKDVVNHRPATPVAVLPLGNENLFAKQMGYTRGPAALARMIAGGRVALLDAGVANGELFTVMLSAGFDAQVVHAVAAWRGAGVARKRVNHISYLKPTLRSVFRYGFVPLAITLDDERVTGSHVLLFNLPRYAAGLGFAPAARADDGLLDYVVFERPGRANLARYLLSVALGRHHRSGDVRCGRAARVTIQSEVPVPLQADGDPAGSTPVNVTVEARTLRVVTA